MDFTYPNGTKALHEVSMKFENGKTTALVGLSGAGKSTVINLLCKFYLPDSGEILLDGVNLNEYNNTFLRNDLGLVLQKKYGRRGIEDNIRYGDMNASFEEIQEMLKLTCMIRLWIFRMVTSMTLHSFQEDSSRELPLPVISEESSGYFP